MYIHVHLYKCGNAIFYYQNIAQVVSCVCCSAGQRENLNSDMDEEDEEEHR